MSIKISIDKRIRNTSTALLLTNFVDEQRQFKRHSLFVSTVSKLEVFREHPFITLVQQLSQDWWMDKFYTVAVSMQAKDESYTLTTNLSFEVPSSYAMLFSQFCFALEETKLWADTQQDWENIISQCDVLMVDGNVEDFLSLLFGTIPDNLFFVPNPFDPSSFGFGVTDGSSTYSIIAPPAIPVGENREPEFSQWGNQLSQMVVHEFSHSLLIADHHHAELVHSTSHLANTMNLKGYFPDMYSNWEGQLNEIIVRAIEIAYRMETAGKTTAEVRLTKEISEFGITLIQPVFDTVQMYMMVRRQGDVTGLCDFFLQYLGREGL